MTTVVRIEIAENPMLITIRDRYESRTRRTDTVYLPGDPIPFMYSTTARSITVVDLDNDGRRARIERKKRAKQKSY